jgi:hypothetical protein
MMSMMKKLAQAIIALLICVLLFLGYVFLIEPLLWERSERKEAFERLDRVHSELERDQFFASKEFTGVGATYSDGKWIALYHVERCRQGITVAIARDSEGNWYESKRHYCAIFRAAKQDAFLTLMGRQAFESSGDESDLWERDYDGDRGLAASIITTTDYDVAVDCLEKLGFRKMQK